MILNTTQVHTLIVEIDIAFQEGILAFSREEFRHYEWLCYRAGEEGFEPTRADSLLLDELYWRIPLDLTNYERN